MGLRLPTCGGRWDFRLKQIVFGLLYRIINTILGKQAYGSIAKQAAGCITKRKRNLHFSGCSFGLVYMLSLPPSLNPVATSGLAVVGWISTNSKPKRVWWVGALLYQRMVSHFCSLFISAFPPIGVLTNKQRQITGTSKKKEML